MSSQAQIDANRENARLSTGPSSPEGLAASAQNARTHGFSSQNTVVSSGQQLAFASFQQEWRTRIQPDGPIEEFLFRRITHAAWTVEMIDQTEAGLFISPEAMLLDDDNEKRTARFARYRTMHMRLFHQAMRSIQYEQTQRGLRAVASPQIAPVVEQTPPQANLPKISEFAKQTQMRERFSTLTPEWQDRLYQVELETHHLNATLRQRKQEDQRKRENAAA